MKKFLAKILLFSLFFWNFNFFFFNNVSAASSGDILITEVWYDTQTQNESEWFELYNPTWADIDISNWKISENWWKFYIFSWVIIPAWYFLLVTNDATIFTNEFWVVPDIDMDEVNGSDCTSDLECLKLNDGWDSLTLTDNSANVIDSVAWEGINGYGLTADKWFSTCRRNLNDSDSDSEWANNCTPTPWSWTFVTQFPWGVPVASLLWTKADSESYSHGDTVTILHDRSWNDRNGTANNTPSFDTANTINFYPTISFDWVNNWVDFPKYSMPIWDKSYTIFTVFKTDLSQDATLAYVWRDYWTNNNTNLILKSDWSLEDDFDNWIANQNSSAVWVISSNVSSLVSFNYNTADNDKNIFLNWKNIATKAGVADHNTSNTATSDRGLWFNADADSDYFKWNIAEILSYDSELSPWDRQKIDSYLSLKYWITLDQTTAYNYINSSWAILWNSTVNTVYTHDVIWIGKNNLSNLDQKISHSINSGSIVTLSSSADFVSLNTDNSRISLDDESFLIIWNSTESVSTGSIEFDANIIKSRINREWKVANTGWVWTIHLKFDWFNSDFTLLKDADWDFSAWAINAWNLNASGEISLTLNDWEYFTLAKEKPLDDFIITVDTSLWNWTNSFEIPTTGGGYNYNVDCDNDGIDEATWITANYTCNYAGAYHWRIVISDNVWDKTGFSRIYFNNEKDKEKLTGINQWGTWKWNSMSSAFQGCSHLNDDWGWAVDSPDLSNATSMSVLFSWANSFNQEIWNWDTWNITNMHAMFLDAPSFNQDISNWDTSKVTNMSYMFSWAGSFNQDLLKNWNNWDTSKVTSMTSMFSDAVAFNWDIGNWDTSGVINMHAMFLDDVLFDQDIGNWDTSKVIDMSFMFYNASIFNKDISNWDTLSVKNMYFMFSNASLFNQNLQTNWNKWNVSNVLNMWALFRWATSFNQDIWNWDTWKVTSMNQMFRWATSFNQDIWNWNTSAVINAVQMFFAASSFNQDVGSWNTSSITNMSFMFDQASTFDQDLKDWDVSNVTNMWYMFYWATLSTANYDSILTAWNDENLQQNVAFHWWNSKYCMSETARQNMIDSDNWSILDAWKECLNDAPTDISLTGSVIDENNSIWNVIWNLSTVDTDIWDIHTYSFIWAWNDNASFTLNGSQILAWEIFDFEIKSSYTIRILTDDQNWGLFEKDLVISINDLDEVAPVITIAWDDIQYVALWDNFTDLWASAMDDIDGNTAVTVSWSVDINITWKYELTYTSTDNSWNISVSTREVFVYLWEISTKTYSAFNWVNAFCNIWSSYEIKDDGDYIEFNARFNDNFVNWYHKSLGLFWTHWGSNQTIWFLADNRVYVRWTSSTWMTFTNLGVVENNFNTYKILVNWDQLELYINWIFAKTTDFISPISIANIANTYGVDFTHADLQDFSIHTAITWNIQSTDIDWDFVCTNNKVYKVIDSLFQNSSLLVDVEENQILIYKPIKNNQYIKYDYRHITDNTKNLNAWTIHDANIVNSDLQHIRKVTELGNWETAIKISWADDFMWWNAHWDEQMTNFIVKIDGTNIDISKYWMRIWSKVEFIEDSDLFAPEWLANVWDRVATAFKHLTFNLVEDNKLLNKLTWVTSETLANAYLFMLPMARNTSEWQVSDVQRVASLYEKVDVSNNWHWAIKYIWNDFWWIVNLYWKDDNIFSHIKVLGWWKNTSEYNTSPSAIYNKMYFDFTGWNYTTSVWEILSWEVEFELWIDTEPTDIDLSNENVDENSATGTIIWDFSVSDIDSRDSHLYSFTWAWNNNDSFSLSGSKLLTWKSFDFENESSYTIRILVDDIRGWTFEKEFTITINDLDDTAPVITIIWANSQDVLINSTFIDSWATWIDNVDWNWTIVSANSWSVDTAIVWTYILEYSKTDSSGNSWTWIRIVHVINWDSPIITLNWEATITQEVGENYTDAWAQYSDVEDWIWSVVWSWTVEINTVWTYILTYNFVDSQWNVASQKTRTVNIIDTTAPTGTTLISPTQWSPVIWTAEPLAIVNITTPSGATCTTTSNTQWTYSCILSPIPLNWEDSIITVTDSSWNGTSIVIEDSIDLQWPVITLSWNLEISLVIWDDFVELWNSCTDNYDVDCSVIVLGDIVNTTIEWTYVITYNATDSLWNVAIQRTRTVIVHPPIIVPPVVQHNSWGWYSKSKKRKWNLEKDSEKKEENRKDEETKDPKGNIVKESQKIRKIKKINWKTIKYSLKSEYKTCRTIDDLLSKNYIDNFKSELQDIFNLRQKWLIKRLEKAWVIDGTKENLFEWNREVSRVEFLKIVLRSHCIEYRQEDTSALNFIDLDNSTWQAKVINKSLDLWIVVWDKDEKSNRIFRANDVISHIEATKILLRMALVQRWEEPDSKYRDLEIEWHNKYVKQWEYLGVFNSKEDNYKFNPDKWINRNKTVEFLYKVIRLYR